MRFLIPTGSEIDPAFYGILTSPSHWTIPQEIRNGKPWAMDNEAFTKGWQPERFFEWLEKMEPYKETCLFVVVPDVVGDAAGTADMWTRWRDDFGDWPVALVAQDGVEVDWCGVWGKMDDPDDETEMGLLSEYDEDMWAVWSTARGLVRWVQFDCLFLGGSTEWKESETAVGVIKAGQKANRHIHIGRVNWGRRYKLFGIIRGHEDFTCDGTRPRYEGLEKTQKAWKAYQKTLMLPLF